MAAGPVRRRREAARVRALVAALALLALALEGVAQAQTAEQRPGGPRTLEIAVDEVVVGDEGYGVTAGAGNRLERFPVEVLGVQHDAGAGFPLVLVRASGAFIDASGGVAAGMSGSPVYLSTEHGDALLGAIGYVFPNADHQLALVTPIADMRAADRATPRATLEVPGLGVAHAAATPVLLTGAGPRAAALLEPLFRDARVAPFAVQAGGAGPAAAAAVASADDAYRLEPGSAVAVVLISGDVQMSAVGTVTEVDDGRVLAFGHPFMGLGEASLPFVPAHVTAIVPSSEVPFKLANVGRRQLGAVTQDRPTALAGHVGRQAETIPVTLTLIGAPGESVFEFEVAADERLYPILTATATLQLLDRALGATDGGFAELAWEIGLRGGERVNVLEQVNDAGDIALAAARLAGGPLALLAENVYREADVRSIAINARLVDRQRVASLEEAILEADEVTAGEAAHVHLRLQPHRERAVVRTVTVPIPDELLGSVTLLIRGGGVPRAYGDLEVDEREIDAPRTFGELLDALRQRVQASELVVEAVSADGELHRLLRTPFPFVVDGHESVELSVMAGVESAPDELEQGDEPDADRNREPGGGVDAVE